MTARLGSTSAFQPAIVPSSVANSSVLGPERPPEEIVNPKPPLVAAPVGADVPPPGRGIVTGGARDWPLGSIFAAVPDPFSEIQTPCSLKPRAIPHGFTRFGSVRCATPGTSEMRLVSVKVGEPAAAARCAAGT